MFEIFHNKIWVQIRVTNTKKSQSHYFIKPNLTRIQDVQRGVENRAREGIWYHVGWGLKCPKEDSWFSKQHSTRVKG